MGGHGADAVEGGCEGGKDVRVGLEGTLGNRFFFTQLTSMYFLGVEAADLVEGVLGGGAAREDGVATAGAAVLTGAEAGAGAVGGEVKRLQLG